MNASFSEWNGNFYKSKNCVIIIGGGLSCRSIELEILSNIPFIVVNSACRMVKSVAKEFDILYFSDFAWCVKYNDLVQGWPGIVMTMSKNAKIKYKDLYEINVADVLNLFHDVSDSVRVSSGHIAACLATYLGAKKIVLIGFECGIVSGRSHGHDDYSAHTIGMYKNRYIPCWNMLAPKFKELNVEVVNSTPNSEIKCFEYQPLEKALVS